MRSSKPLSTSTEILAKIKIPSIVLSRFVLMYFPIVFLISSNTLWCQKWRGRLCNLTHTDILETTIILTSKPKNHGVWIVPHYLKTMIPSLRRGPCLAMFQILRWKIPWNICRYCTLGPSRKNPLFWQEAIKSNIIALFGRLYKLRWHLKDLLPFPKCDSFVPWCRGLEHLGFNQICFVSYLFFWQLP